MKKLILSILGGMAMLPAFSAVDIPIYFSEDFSDVSKVPEGWIQYGVDATPSGNYASFFSNYGPGNYFTILNRPNPGAYSPSAFAGGVSSDQWLITPEIKIEDAEVLLKYTVGVEGNTEKNRFKVLVSEGGTAKEDFKKSLVSTTITGKGSSLNTLEKRIVVEGYKGKTIRLAFVNCENTSGFVGFGNFKLAQYDLTYDPEDISNLIIRDDSVLPTFNFQLSTPMAANGVTAVLTTDNGYSSQVVTTSSFGSGMYSNCTIQFPDPFTMERSKVQYRLTVTPNFEGAQTAVIEGAFLQPAYPAMAVMEEYTGTWCSNCPRGIAYMNYYSDNFGFEDKETYQPAFIGVAFHYDDPMQFPAFLSVQALLPSNSYPTAFLNRVDTEYPKDPTDLDVRGWLTRGSVSSIKIGKVDYSGSKLSVDYGVAVCYDLETPHYNVMAYVIENNVTGSGDGYVQVSNYSGRDEANIIRNYGEEFVPYFRPFMGVGSLVVGLKFNEVARGLYPSMTGTPFTAPLEACVYGKDHMEFTMPSNILDKNNVEVVLLLIDTRDGHISSADKVGYENFNKVAFDIPDGVSYPPGFDPTVVSWDPSSISEVSSNVTLRVNDGVIYSNAGSESILEVYSIEGRLLKSKHLSAGSNSTDVDSEGLVIVRLRSNEGTRTIKALL